MAWMERRGGGIEGRTRRGADKWEEMRWDELFRKAGSDGDDDEPLTNVILPIHRIVQSSMKEAQSSNPGIHVIVGQQ